MRKGSKLLYLRPVPEGAELWLRSLKRCHVIIAVANVALSQGGGHIRQSVDVMLRVDVDQPASTRHIS